MRACHFKQPVGLEADLGYTVRDMICPVHGEIGNQTWPDSVGYLCNVPVGLGPPQMFPTDRGMAPMGPPIAIPCNRRVTLNPAEAAEAARRTEEVNKAAEDRLSAAREVLDAATSPQEGASVPLVDYSAYGSRERERYGSFGPPRGLDFRACWLRLVQSRALPATHRLMHVTVNLVRRRFGNYTRIHRLSVEDSGVMLWEAFDPRMLTKGSIIGPPPDRYWFQDLPLDGSSARDKDHMHVFLVHDGRVAYGDTYASRGFFTDPYRSDEEQPFRAPEQHIWYACPIGFRFAPARRGKYVPTRQYPRDALAVDVSHTRRVIRFESVPEELLQLMYWYSLQLGAGAGSGHS